MYWDHMDGWGGGWMWVWGTVMMVAFVVIVAAVVWVVVRGSQQRSLPAGDRAADILAERFARGEIDSDEYRERRDALGK